eukprot:1537-Hanusia_phi.AAC.1
MARLASAQDAVFTFLATRHQAHMMFDTDSSGKLWTQIHVRILLPQVTEGEEVEGEMGKLGRTDGVVSALGC